MSHPTTPAEPVTVEIPAPVVTVHPDPDVHHAVEVRILGEDYGLTPEEAMKLGSDLLNAGYAAWDARRLDGA